MNMKDRLILLVGLSVTMISTLCGASPENPWMEVEEMISGDQVIKGLEKAAALAKADPRDRRMGRAIGCLTQVGLLGDKKAYEAADVPAAKIVGVLRQSFKKAPHVDTAMNLAKVATAFYQNRLLTKTQRSELYSDIRGITRWEKCTSALYVATAQYFSARSQHALALEMLSRAEALAEQAENPRWLRKRIAYQQADVILDRDGKHSELAVPFLQRVVQLDDTFVSSANRALCQLGSIALAHGDVGLAKTYLSLASRVNLDPVLRSFGYERGLAFELIQNGYPNSAIEYLTIAYKNEPEPHAETVLGLGLGHLKKDNTAEAIKWFQKYLTLEYKPAEAFVRNILKAMRQGDPNSQPKASAKEGTRDAKPFQRPGGDQRGL